MDCIWRLRFLSKQPVSLVFERQVVSYLCGQSTLGWSETRKRKIRDLEQRSHRTILPNPTCLTCVLRLPTVENTLMRKACNFVFDCLQGNVCTPFKNYFNFLTHNRDTRNCRATVVLPKVKLEFARKSFYFSGANIFNSLPLKTRQTSSRVLFRQSLNELFL